MIEVDHALSVAIWVGLRDTIPQIAALDEKRINAADNLRAAHRSCNLNRRHYIDDAGFDALRVIVAIAGEAVAAEAAGRA